jgi:peptidoglycan-N-acetylglucosamine deacetylase
MRRGLIAVLVAIVLVAALAGCDGKAAQDDQASAGSTPGSEAGSTMPDGSAPATSPPVTSPPASAPSPTLPPISPAVPGPALVLRKVPGAVGKVALTFDDGFCGDCVGTMVGDLERTGAHVTFCPNGAYGKVWQPYVERIKALVAKGQLEICNHTWDHKKITRLSSAQLTQEITHNEQWIEDTFGVTARPFFRPPYGSRSAASDAVAGSLGYTNVILWSSTLSDSILQPPETVMQQLQINLVPGGIVLGHLNYPTTGQVFDQILAVLAQRGLVPVTVAELVAAGAAT